MALRKCFACPSSKYHVLEYFIHKMGIMSVLAVDDHISDFQRYNQEQIPLFEIMPLPLLTKISIGFC